MEEGPVGFGDRLRVLRLKAGFKTPGALAVALGDPAITEGAIRQMESGQTKMANLVNGLRLAPVLGVSPWYLAGLPEPSATDAHPQLREAEETPDVLDLQERLAALNKRLAPVFEMLPELQALLRRRGKQPPPS